MTIENLQFVMPASFKCPRNFYFEESFNCFLSIGNQA